jgi:hypothetical protein
MIIAYISHPALTNMRFPLHPDYKDNPIKTRCTYKLDEKHSQYCQENDVIYYDAGKHINALETSLDSFVDKSLMDKLRNKQALLAIDQTEEAFYIIVEKIYKHIIIEQNIPAEQILLLCHSFDFVDKIKEMSRLYNLPEIKCEFYNFWERQKKLIFLRTFNDLGLTSYEQYFDKIKSGLYHDTNRAYVNLTNNWREHRFALLCLLENYNLIERGYNSFNLTPTKQGLSSPADILNPFKRHMSKPKHIEIKEKQESEEKWNHWHSSCLNVFDKIQDEIKGGYQVKTKLPLVLDSVDFNNYLGFANQTYLFKYFKDSYLSVVSETGYMKNLPDTSITKHYYFGDTAPVFITEKLYKAIGNKHPFIFVGIEKSLEHIRRMGYKTFDEIIDESYDVESDDSLRLLKIVNEISRISNLKDNELTDFKNKCKDIVEYNFTLFFTRQNYIIRLI